MTVDFSTDMPWVVLRLRNQKFAVSTDNVREMVAMPKVVSLPQTPHYIRGVISLRDQVIPVIDLRERLGITSAMDEVDDLIKLLDQREQDHREWIIELESSVKERREFKLATDHNQCEFGKWYNNYKTENRILESCLKKIDAPHKRIHAIAVEVKELEGAEDFDSAFSIIERTRDGDLAEMIRLFSEARGLIKETHREIAMIIESSERTMAAAVDSVETVEKLLESSIEEVPTIAYTMDNECVSGIGKREKGDELVQILDVSNLIEQEEDLFSQTNHNL